MDTTLSIKVPGTVVPYVIYLASKNCIILRAGLTYISELVPPGQLRGMTCQDYSDRLLPQSKNFGPRNLSSTTLLVHCLALRLTV